ncbi:MAG TPA: MogA/MoaB family molybdenum cofactor biosynthesis protein [Bryobacteraceae bacterium]|nr:MogA/MoaB family molybdenum cofactor biosynthesis protein [Bryobacteraceae bacterium]
MIRVAILTLSDSSVAGAREDVSGARLQQSVQQLGWTVTYTGLLPDERDQIGARLRELADSGLNSVILTTGGTGVALRDVTPEATRDVIEREIPGLGELMRIESRKFTPNAVLSRATAGTRGRTLIVNLPGSPKGAVECFDIVSKLIPHVVDLIEGRTGHASVPN